jgi:DNA-binding Lrp family transcriptional regulator
MWIKELNEFYSFWEDTLKKYRVYFHMQQFSIYIQTQSFLNEYLLGSEHIVNRLEYTISGASIDRKIDSIDTKLLQIIGNDARITIVELSDILGITFNAVKQRIIKLKKLGIIRGFRVEIDYKKLGYQFYKADINLTNYAMRSQIIQYIKQNPNLIRIDKSIGVSDLELEFLVPNHDYFYKIMNELLHRFQDNIKNYQYLYTSSYCDMKYLPKI